MIVLRWFLKFLKLLNSETSENALGLAFALGMALALMPILSLQGLLVLAVILFFRVNITAALLTFAIFSLLRLALFGVIDGLGVALLERESLAGLWAWLSHAPVLSFLGLNHSTTLGGTIIALVLAAPVFLIARTLVKLYRQRFERWWSGLAIATAIRSSWVYQIYLWFDSPFHR